MKAKNNREECAVSIQEQIKTLESAEMQEAKKGNFQLPPKPYPKEAAKVERMIGRFRAKCRPTHKVRDYRRDGKAA